MALPVFLSHLSLRPGAPPAPAAPPATSAAGRRPGPRHWSAGATVCGSLWMCSKVRALLSGRGARLRLAERVKEVQRYHRGELSEFELGVSTGYASLDEIFRPVRGEVNTVCGAPGSGKSEFMLSLAMNLAELHGWKTGLCLFEHKPDQLTLQLLEKKAKTHFLHLATSLNAEVAWINEHFLPLSHFADETPLAEILSRAARYAQEGVLQNLIIDPYNYLELPAGLGKSFNETQLVSCYMTMLQQFAKKYQVCVWVVVHPTKGSQISGGGPSLYDLQGSAHWNNKCDKGLYVCRPNKDPENGSTRTVDIHVLKVRNGDSGRVGMRKLEFRPDIRSYEEKTPVNA